MKRILLFSIFFLNTVCMHTMPNKRIKTGKEKLIQEVNVPVECRYCASRGVKVEFPSLKDELQHILNEHGIIASAEIRFEKYENVPQIFSSDEEDDNDQGYDYNQDDMDVDENED